MFAHIGVWPRRGWWGCGPWRRDVRTMAPPETLGLFAKYGKFGGQDLTTFAEVPRLNL
ncbi:hypothetical protein LguiB_005575 [Lonicera macranthoides]